MELRHGVHFSIPHYDNILLCPASVPISLFSLSGASSLSIRGVMRAFRGKDIVMKTHMRWWAEWEDLISQWLRAVPGAHMGSPSSADRSHSFSGLQLVQGSGDGGGGVSSPLQQFSSHWLLSTSQMSLKNKLLNMRIWKYIYIWELSHSKDFRLYFETLNFHYQFYTENIK